jgi:hypothetical protein
MATTIDDETAAATIACSRWERLETASRLHGEALHELESDGSEENAALVAVTESVLEAILGRE